MVKEVWAYLHTHWDREWYKTFGEFRLRLCDVLDDIFQKLDNNDINSFYLDGQVVALNDYLEIHPEKLEYVKNLIKSKKLYIGPFYDLADEFLVNGESLARNLLIGIHTAKNYGADEKDFIGYLPDAFGHCANMPMLLKKSGINNALVWRGLKSDKQEFSWISPDGSAIRTIYLPIGYFQDFLHKKSYKKNLNKLLQELEKYTLSDIPVILPVGGDHLACAEKIKAKIKNFNRNNTDFHIKLSSLQEYFEKVSAGKSAPKIKGELRNNENSYILMGTASSRVDLKKLNAISQWNLGKIVEPLYSLFSDILPDKKENVDCAWKTLIKNHAHDSICGCSLDEVHEENILRYKKVMQICSALKDFAILKFSEKISKKEIGIINLSNFTYSGVYSFWSDKKLPLVCVNKKKSFPKEISQNLYTAPVQENYHYFYEYLAQIDNIRGGELKILIPKKSKNNNLKISKTSVSNEFLEIKINPEGSFNIKNKQENIELKNLFRISDEADVGDSYNFSCILDDKPICAKFTSSKVLEDNDLVKTLRLKYSLNVPSHALNDKKRSAKCIKHEFFVDLILAANSKRLDMNINYENFSKDHILKLNFALPKTIVKVKSEDTFGIIERSFEPNYNYKNQIPLSKYKEADINTGIFQRFAMTQGLCVITKGLNEYEVKNNNLNITLLRSFGVISKKTLLTRTAAAGPPLPVPNGQMLGKQSVQLALVLTYEEQEAFRQADFFYNPLVVVDGKAKQTTYKNRQMFDCGENLYLYNVKKAEDKSGLIAKIFNYDNKQQEITVDRELYETNLLEEKISEKNMRNKKINFKPNELKILKIK